jgi:hypothetical protein
MYKSSYTYTWNKVAVQVLNKLETLLEVFFGPPGLIVFWNYMFSLKIIFKTVLSRV